MTQRRARTISGISTRGAFCGSSRYYGTLVIFFLVLPRLVPDSDNLRALQSDEFCISELSLEHQNRMGRLAMV